METSAVSSSNLRRLLVPLGLTVFACISVGKFPGAAGWIGGAGWLLLAATIFARPSTVVTSEGLSRPNGGLTVLSFALSLALIVGSVVVWAGAR